MLRLRRGAQITSLTDRIGWQASRAVDKLIVGDVEKLDDARQDALALLKEYRALRAQERKESLWVEKRKKRIKTGGDEETRLKRYVFPHLGAMRIDLVKPRHMELLLWTLRDEMEPGANEMRHAPR